MATRVIKQVKVVDKGADKLIKAMRANRFRTLKVGVLAPDSDVQYTGRQGPTTVGEAAFFNEFGTENAPARSWLRSWVDGNIQKLQKQQLRLYQAILLRQKGNEQAGLTALGEQYVKQIIAQIETRIPPPNAQFTVEKKGFDFPLVDSGLFKQSITHEVSDPE